MAQVITTVGYGDVTPTSSLAKLRVSAYSLASLIIIAYVLNKLIQSVLKLQQLKVVKAAHLSTYCACLHDEALRNLFKYLFVFSFYLACGIVFYGLREACTCGYDQTGSGETSGRNSQLVML
ncbi:unnamed protein product [Polarella glacialis]|uniref:Potassium channel domain-containing protein n=1 Tax=Polarella glacialis TaxID=89957 RepID=A0A813D518_POLGL|nr:unnamed protein product [Polarella glacialis]